MHVETQSLEETLKLGRLLGTLAPVMPAVTCIALDGPLGAGKTHLTRGLALGAHTADLSLVSSPTYVIMNIYEGNKRIYHLDAYRVESIDAFEELGFGAVVAGELGGGIVVVEWARRVAEVMPVDTLWIALEHAGETCRSLDLVAGGATASTLLRNFEAAWVQNGLDG